MEIRHGSVTSKGKNADFLLVNKRGSYFSLGEKTNLQGLHMMYKTPDAWSYYKIIDNIFLNHNPDEIINHLSSIQRRSDNANEKFFLLDHGLVYDVKNYVGEVTIDLDFRDIYDYSEWDRNYKILNQLGLIIIQYKKQNQEFFMVIKGAKNYTPVEQWVEKNYPYDQTRGTKSKFWVYRALKLHVEGSAHFLISYGSSITQAIRSLKSLEDKRFDEIHKEFTYLKHLTGYVPKMQPAYQMGYACALKSLENMILNLPSGDKKTTGIFAGLPWFFQFWTRDELISLKALMHHNKSALIKIILLKHLNRIGGDGRIPNRTPDAMLATADGIGWFWKTFSDFIQVLKKKNQLKHYFNNREMDMIKEKLEYSIKNLYSNYGTDGLIWNMEKETWMDTSYGGDKRDGKRIEIQAMYLNMLNLASNLFKGSKARKIKKLEHTTVKKVREVFYKNGILFDGEGDSTIRPNIFLAHNIFPQLLTKKEWISVFENTLPELWLHWGGLSSISKNNPMFKSKYGGENNESYHRGDSWFWINNLAAISMFHLDKKKFGEYIDKIVKASTEDILFNGFIGHASEISSAEKQDASGSWCQSWSNSTLIELYRTLYS